MKPDEVENRIVCDTKNEPAAWVAFACDGSESRAVFLSREAADEAAKKYGWFVAELWAKPTLARDRTAAYVSGGVSGGWVLPAGHVVQLSDRQPMTLTPEEREAVEELRILAREHRPNSDRVKGYSYTAERLLRRTK